MLQEGRCISSSSCCEHCDTLIWGRPWRTPHLSFPQRVCLRCNCRQLMLGVNNNCRSNVMESFPYPRVITNLIYLQGRVTMSFKSCSLDPSYGHNFSVLRTSFSKRYVYIMSQEDTPHQWVSWLHQSWTWLLLSHRGDLVWDFPYLITIPDYEDMPLWLHVRTCSLLLVDFI